MYISSAALLDSNDFMHILELMPNGVLLVDANMNIIYVNKKATNLLNMSSHSLNENFVFKKIKHKINDVIENENVNNELEVVINSKTFLAEVSPYYANENLKAILITFKEVNEKYKDLDEDINAIFESSYDVIYVSDSEGNTLRVSSACKRLWGLDAEELIGRNVRDLEKEGIYNPSITRLVLESKEKITTIQTTKAGKRLLVSGTPILDDHGEIVRVVNVSKDITELSKLQNEIDELKKLIQGYKKELSELKNEEQQSIFYKSKEMEKVVHMAKKVATVDSTVLIHGESGVGKEVIANLIHTNSNRRKKPFIKINCGAIPESLLESELFGYEKGAFTGANRQGKIGLFEYANEGTIFLDEIGEMPLPLQVKILRVLQEQEFTRIGGQKPIKINVRIIAATNRDLKEEIKKGNFREDLYYRLNVIPINVPPLRKRKEDIIPLILHFIEKYNQKYLLNKTIDENALNVLENYGWPGNVRELQNIIERLMIISDQNEITVKSIPDSLIKQSLKDSVVEVHDILPLKECITQAEKQLLLLAKSKYISTVEIAKALEVNQSTISRKLHKYKI